jgi:hypothetical protein
VWLIGRASHWKVRCCMKACRTHSCEAMQCSRCSAGTRDALPFQQCRKCSSTQSACLQEPVSITALMHIWGGCCGVTALLAVDTEVANPGQALLQHSCICIWCLCQWHLCVALLRALVGMLNIVSMSSLETAVQTLVLLTGQRLVFD